MQALTWRAQVYALGAAIERAAVERAAEREVMRVTARACGSRPRFNYELILAAMKPNRAYTWAQLEAASGLPTAKFRSALSTAISNRRIDRTLDRDGSVYSLP